MVQISFQNNVFHITLPTDLEEHCKISVKYGWQIIEMSCQEFQKKAFRSIVEWKSILERPLEVKSYLVTSDGPNYLKECWISLWNGNFFEDEKGRPYFVTRWLEIPSDGYVRKKMEEENINQIPKPTFVPCQNITVEKIVNGVPYENYAESFSV